MTDDVVFSRELAALYTAAGRPPHRDITRVGRRWRPPVSWSTQSLSDWTTGKRPPSDEHVVRCLIGYLQPLAEDRAGASDGFTRRSVDDWWIPLWRQERTRRANRGGRPAAPASASGQGRESARDDDGFAATMRGAAARLHGRMLIGQPGQVRLVDHDAMYVAQRRRLASANSDLEMGLEAAVVQAGRAVVLGDPGTGKSTLAAKLVHDIATDRAVGCSGLVPVLMIVREHTGSLEHSHRTLLGHLMDCCRRPYQIEPPKGALEHLLRDGRVFIVVDGVDELGSGVSRMAFAQMVNGFAHLYPRARILVTSRIIGYADASLDPDLFRTIEIAEFDYMQIKEYVTKSFELDHRPTSEDLPHLVETFMSESRTAHDLSGNPLLLSLLCSLASDKRHLPRSRPELYEQCAELLFEEWDKSRDIKVQHRFHAQIRPAVRSIAWHIFTTSSDGQTLPGPALRRYLADYLLRGNHGSEDEASQAAVDFLTFCTGRAWVLTEVGHDRLEPQYGFVHRTFLEFFAAEELVNSAPDPDAIWGALAPHVHNATWSLLSLTAVQLLERSHPGGAYRLLELVLLSATENRTAAAFDRGFLVFAANCLGVVTASTTTIQRLAEAAVAHAASVDVAARRTTNRYFSMSPNQDRPLEVLLALKAPDNAKNVGGAVAEALVTACADAAPYSGAGLIYAVLAHTRRDHADESAEAAAHTELRRHPDPPVVEVWDRALSAPTEADVARLGPLMLYEETSVAGHRHASYAEVMLLGIQRLERFSAHDREGLLAELGHLREIVIADFADYFAFPRMGATTHPRSWDFSEEALDRLPPATRGVALMMVLVALHLGIIGGTSRDGKYSARLQHILAARTVPRLRAEVAQDLSERDVDAEVRDTILRWIHSNADNI